MTAGALVWCFREYSQTRASYSFGFYVIITTDTWKTMLARANQVMFVIKCAYKRLQGVTFVTILNASEVKARNVAHQ